MICLNLTLVIHFFPKNIEGFEFLLLIFKVVPLSKLMTPYFMKPSESASLVRIEKNIYIII